MMPPTLRDILSDADVEPPHAKYYRDSHTKYYRDDRDDTPKEEQIINAVPAPINHIEDIKLHIRQMPFGDTMALAGAASSSTEKEDPEIDAIAKRLWAWAHT